MSARSSTTLKDANRARALLREANYRNEEFIILTDSSFSNQKAAGEVAAEQLKAVGVNVRLNVVD